MFGVEGLFVKVYFIPFFSPMRYAAAGGHEMKAPFNSNLPYQTGDVMVNPINPASKQGDSM